MMVKMKSMVKVFLLAAGMVFAAGCSNLSYVGQEFAPTPPGQKVEIFAGRKAMPLDKYVIIGKITLEDDLALNKYVAEKELVAKTRAVGGDAVCIAERRVLRRGAYTTMEEQHGAAPRAPGKALTEKYGNPAPLTGESSYMSVVQIRALVLKDKEAVKKLLDK